MHKLDYTTGDAGIAFVGELPWHGLGTRVDPDSTLEQWRTAARLDWTVHSSEVLYTGFGQHQFVMPDRRVLWRSDSESPLAVVSDQYKPHQPKALIEFYRDLISEFGFRMHTMGALDGGKRIWALAETGAGYTLDGVDKVHTFLLLATSYDGTMATQARWTDVRVVCNNTLTVATSEKVSDVVRVSHRNTFDARKVKEDLGIDVGLIEYRAKLFDAMAQRPISNDQAAEYFAEVCNTDSMTARSPVTKMMHAFTSSPGANLPTAKGTLWGAVNAVTHVQDFVIGANHKRWSSATFGSGNARKQRAVQVATEMLEAA